MGVTLATAYQQLATIQTVRKRLIEVFRTFVAAILAVARQGAACSFVVNTLAGIAIPMMKRKRRHSYVNDVDIILKNITLRVTSRIYRLSSRSLTALYGSGGN